MRKLPLNLDRSPCAVYKLQGHPTQKYSEIPIIRAHLDAMDTTKNLLMVELPSAPIVRNESLRKNHACTLCELNGHYSHHFQYFLEFRMALANLRQHSLESEITLIKVHPPPPSSDTMSIYMMSSSTDPLVSTTNNGPSDLSLCCFYNDEEILEALTSLEYPQDDMHHCSFFLLEEIVSQSDQFSVETKDFIHGKVDWFKNPIPALDSFEEGNVANISHHQNQHLNQSRGC